MRYIRIALVAASLVSALGVAACANMPGGAPGDPTTGTDISQIVKNIQTATVTACAFQPTISTVSSIIGTFTGAGQAIAAANDIAAQICSAIAVPKSARRGGAQPQFCSDMGGRCVAIHGKWVGR